MKSHPKLHGVQGRYTAAELECLSNRPMKLREPPPWLLEPPPANPKCPVVEAAFGGSSGTLVPTSGAVDCTERYSTLLHCGGVSILLRRAEARAGPTIHHDYWWTVLRAATLGGRIGGFGGNTTTLGPALRMSHNTAFMCAPDGQTVLAYGGRRKSLNGAFGFRDEPGILRAEGRLEARPGGAVSISWSTPSLVLDGSPASGCVEARSNVGTNCEFDGKLSVVRWRGRTLLYARANVAECGGRHVQMTSSADGVRDWSRWQLLEFEGGRGIGGRGQAASNLYFFAVRAETVRLIAFFPTVVGNVGGLFASTSDDGVRWRTPHRLLASSVKAEYRTEDYPVDGSGMLTKGSSATSLLVEVGVVLEHGPALRGCVRPAFLCAYDVKLPSAWPSEAGATSLEALRTAATPRFKACIQCFKDAGCHEGRECNTCYQRNMGPCLGICGQEHVSLPLAQASMCGANDATVRAADATPFQMPPSPARCARPVALLMRGEAFRWGCSADALAWQMHAVRTHLQLAARLEGGEGGCAHFFVAVDNRVCGGTATRKLLGAFGARLAAQTTFSTPPADQGVGVQAVVALFKDKAASIVGPAGVLGYTRIVLSRIDLALLTPNAAPWACTDDSICVASKCEAAGWDMYKCVNDLLFMAPGSRIPALLQSLGSSDGASDNEARQCGCFDAKCPKRGFNKRQHGSGHDCFNVMAKEVGASAISFAWPQVTEKIASPNPNYEMPKCEAIDAGASYKGRSCSHGRGRLGKTMIMGGTIDKRALSLGKPIFGKSMDAKMEKMDFMAQRLGNRRLINANPSVAAQIDHKMKKQWRRRALGAQTEREQPPARVAVCLSGQLRTMRTRGLHVHLKKHMVDVLNADVFVHVDAADTRPWGVKAEANSNDFNEVVRVLNAKGAKLESYQPQPVPPSACAGPGERRVCKAFDCGTFTCGCYVAGCTHCVTTQYIPQHLHTSECLELVAAHEAARGSAYDFVVKIRPDLNVTRPVPSFDEIERLVSPREGPPALCAQGGGPTLDDKFALMPRRVAAVYMNATKVYEVCQSREVNEPDCSGGKGGKGGKGAMFKGGREVRSLAMKSRAMSKDARRRMKAMYKVGKGRPSAEGDLPHGRGRRLQVWTSPAYWATPQCVLKRHLIAHLPELRIFDCLRGEGSRGVVLRLVRPEMGRRL